VCSIFDVDAITMLAMQLIFLGGVFRFLWHGGVGPSNALVHGASRPEQICGFCGETGCGGGCCA